MRLLGTRLHLDLGSSGVWVILNALICTLLLTLGAINLGQGLRAQLLWSQTEGRVVAIEYRGSSRNRVPYAHFVFTAPDDGEIRARTPRTSAFHPAKVGDSVTVAFSPSNPDKAELIHAGHLYGLPMIYLCGAAFFGWLTKRNFDGAIQLLVADRSEGNGDSVKPAAGLR